MLHAGGSLVGISRSHWNAAHRSAWRVEPLLRLSSKNISARCILKIWLWPPLAAKEVRRLGSIFSPSTALTCARRRPRFFDATRVPRKLVISRIPFYGKGNARPLFCYFHGRSSLKTWLRAVLAQRHIDSIRAGRRFEELGEDETGEGLPRTRLGPQMQPSDPHRERYVASFTRALQTALERLEPQEKERLRLYYAEEKTLAEIGRLRGEHESSVSRHLHRARRDLRHAVEDILRHGIGSANGSAVQPGLSDAEIALCFEYCSEDNPIDLEKLLPRAKSPGPAAGKRTP